MPSIHDAIYDILDGHGGVNGLVAHRIYRNEMPQAPIFPLIVYFRVSKVRPHAMAVDVGVSITRFQVTAWDQTHAGADALATQIKLALSRYSGAINGTTIQDSLQEDEHDLRSDEVQEKGMHQIPLDFMISYLE